MSKRIDFSVIEDKKELKRLQYEQKVFYRQQRLTWLVIMKEYSELLREDTAKRADISLRTQERWIQRYKEGGVEGLLTDAPNLKKSKIITEEIHKGLSGRVNSSENPFLGYWDAQNWVLSEYGVEVQYHWLRAYLIKHFKTKPKSPRKSHYKKDDKATEAFLKTTKNTR